MRFAQLTNFVLTGRLIRLVVTLTIVPVLALSPLSVDAMLIHYDGHDIHAHTVTLDEFDGWMEAPEHRDSSHDHDCQAHDPNEHGDDFLIVIHLPVAVLRGRNLISAAALATNVAVPSLAAMTPMAVVQHAPLGKGSLFVAPFVGPGRTVSGLLLSNHALLL